MSRSTMSRSGCALCPRAVDFDSAWAALECGLRRVVVSPAVRGAPAVVEACPLMERVYECCTAAPAPYIAELHARLRAFFEAHTDQQFDVLRAHTSDLLEEYLRLWEAFAAGCEGCHRLFRYFNMHCVTKDTGGYCCGGVGGSPQAAPAMHDVVTIGLVAWKQRVYSKLRPHLIEATLDLVRADRDGDAVSLHPIARMVDCLVLLGSIRKNRELDLYQDDLEFPLLRDTVTYYTVESSQLIVHNGVTAYLARAESRIAEEYGRAKRLEQSSLSKLLKLLNTVCVEGHKNEISRECMTYLRDRNVDALGRAYRLLARIDDGFGAVLAATHGWIVTTARASVVAAAPGTADALPQRVVAALITARRDACSVVRGAFYDNPLFVAELDRACHAVANDPQLDGSPSRTPELLARYCDTLLRKGSNRTAAAAATADTLESKLEDRIAEVVSLFKYIDEKDVFLKFYSKLLARRLILGASVSDDAERSLIAGLKNVCGFEYVNKLSRMLSDMAVSADICDQFNTLLHSRTGPHPLGKGARSTN
eukprot:TRINITY_DN3298_c0_g1_i6.p1 TRINITY_DN3298_c0_g1~~TRINITY_DN3298_c0_g1_i6.p1  ORF type:complete len:537 (-),score=106.14 TRINITY_DN3298_c0_g1_i6:981-2591(-)